MAVSDASKPICQRGMSLDSQLIGGLGNLNVMYKYAEMFSSRYHGNVDEPVSPTRRVSGMFRAGLLRLSLRSKKDKK